MPSVFIRNSDEILDEIGDFGRTKNDILDNIFLLSLVIQFITVQNDYYFYYCSWTDPT